MHATHEADLNLPHLPRSARRCKIVPTLNSGTLISIGQLCDAGCLALFTKSAVHIYHDGLPVLSGTRSGPNQLWQLKPSTDAPAVALAARPSFLPTTTSAADIVAFQHASLGSPVLSTLKQALDRGYVFGFPGLTSRTLRNHPPFSIATVKGHQDATRKNVQSTRPIPSPDPDDTFFPDSDSPNQKTHELYSQIHEVTGRTYTDLTGAFVVPSSRGNKYVLVLYDYDSNLIMAAPLKTRHASAILNAHKLLLQHLRKAGLKPSLMFLDNECPTILKTYFNDEGIDFQLVPPVQHRRNAAERAIRTWKNHFIAILATADDGFPLHLWDRLIFQANLTLNLLRGSRLNPALSAWAQIFGHYDYNRTPIAPLGTHVLAHENASTRLSWGAHAQEGWYVGPATESYRCFTIWLDETRHTRIVERCTWFPAKIGIPVPTTADNLNDALLALKDALTNTNVDPLLQSIDASRRNALKELGTVLTNADNHAAVDISSIPVSAAAAAATPASPRVPNFLTEQLPYLDSYIHFCGKVFHPDTGQLVEYAQLRHSSEGARWDLACTREWARLLNGPPPDIPSGRNTFRFISKSDVPSHKKVTYLRIVSNFRPQKADPYRIRFTVGGDRLDYAGETTTRTSDLTTFKIGINAILSRPGWKACTLDLSDSYLCHRLPHPEYMRIHKSLVPHAIMDHYRLSDFIAPDHFEY